MSCWAFVGIDALEGQLSILKRCSRDKQSLNDHNFVRVAIYDLATLKTIKPKVY